MVETDQLEEDGLPDPKLRKHLRPADEESVDNISAAAPKKTTAAEDEYRRWALVRFAGVISGMA